MSVQVLGCLTNHTSPDPFSIATPHKEISPLYAVALDDLDAVVDDEDPVLHAFSPGAMCTARPY